VHRNLVEAADAERREIERALHDGVQQDLIALSVRLQLARRVADDDPAAAVRLLDDMSRDVADALDRVRRLADSVYPSLLSPLGLVEALRAAGHVVDANGIGRFTPAVEAAAYFFCKDAAGGTPTAVRLDGGGDTLVVGLELACPDPNRLTAARQRIEALGGEMKVEPAEGRVYVSAAIPSARPSLR
jgi:signal transduction histidine kinase